MTRMLIAIGAVATAYAIAVSFMLVEYNAVFRILGPALFRSAAIRSAMWVALLPLTVIAMRAVLQHVRNVIAQAAALTAICLVAAVLAEGSFLAYAIGQGWLRRPFGAERETLSTMLTTLLASLHAPFTFLIGMTMGARWLAVSSAQQTAEVRGNRVEARLSEARARLLRSQVHPHFLFNSLNSVAALVRSEPEIAAGMLDRLSRFYAIAAATEGRQTVTLREELGFVRQYVDIEQIRFGPRLRTVVDVPPELLEVQVPTLILQPLAENAIKHGISNCPGPGTLAVRATGDRAHLVIAVEDSGSIEPHASRNGIGLANTRERLRQLYGSGASVAMEAIADGTRVTLAIPRT
jgi:two-component system, LytTR family, sensor kinase